jgi:FkbM family methyltransferase
MKRLIRRALHRMGWDLRRFNPNDCEWAQLVRQLAAHDVNVVLDVGANVGQFAKSLRDSGFQGRIISFEPLAIAHRKLQKQARRDRNWIVAPRVAVGDRDGRITVNVSGNGVSSSVLPMLTTHLHAEPDSQYVGCEEVDMRQLDTLAEGKISACDRTFLKLDVQGFEYQVLKGASRLLSQVVGIRLEMPLIPLYDGDHLFDSMLRELTSAGFELWSLLPAFLDQKTGRLLQVDGTFFRPRATPPCKHWQIT